MHSHHTAAIAGQCCKVDMWHKKCLDPQKLVQLRFTEPCLHKIAEKLIGITGMYDAGIRVIKSTDTLGHIGQTVVK